MREPAVVRTPRVANWSFTAKATPCSGRSASPRVTASSARRAASTAVSRHTVM